MGRWRQAWPLERTELGAPERMPREEGSGYLVEELDLVRWFVGQGFGLLSRVWRVKAL